MIALLAIAPDGSSYSQLLDMDKHNARREQRRLERLDYSHFQLVSMPVQNDKPEEILWERQQRKDIKNYSDAKLLKKLTSQ
jgi:hypothetical protein